MRIAASCHDPAPSYEQEIIPKDGVGSDTARLKYLRRRRSITRDQSYVRMHFVAFVPTSILAPCSTQCDAPCPNRDRTREQMSTPKKWTVQMRQLQKACPGRLQCIAIHATAECNSLHPGAANSVLDNLLYARHIRVTHLAFRTSSVHRTLCASPAGREADRLVQALVLQHRVILAPS